MVVSTIEIGGMHAVHAARAIYTALSGVEGVTRAEVSLGRAVVWHDGRATAAHLTAAIELAGCEVLGIAEERRSLPVL
jgi:copper chaperone CopZ